MSADGVHEIPQRGTSHYALRSGAMIAAVVVIVGVAAWMRQAPRATDAEAAPTATPATVGLPRMLDLGADKCIPCKQMAPILVEVRNEYAGKAAIDFIDVWKNPSAAEPYGVRVIPTQIFFDRAGKEVWRHEGFLSKAEIVAKLKELGAGDA